MGVVICFFVFVWLNCVEWCLKVGKLKFNVLLLFNFLVKMTRYKIIYLFIFIIINY